MITILALIGAIFGVTFVLQLRAALAFPYPRLRHVALAAAPDSAGDPYFAQFVAQAREAGFSGPEWTRSERVDGEPWPFADQAVFRAADGTGLLWATPQPYRLDAANSVLAWYSHRLADGRVAISQPFESFFSIVQGGELAVRIGVETDVARQWQAHRAWVDTLGSAPVAVADPLADAQRRDDAIRARLTEQGDVRPVDPDLALPSLAFALRMRRESKATPKPPADPRPVPVPRLARLAMVQELFAHRSPARAAQWWLFLASVVLFLALGAVVWDVRVATAVGIVVLVHELGHFLAMRAFGYRNTHILALPLVGGVAMGHDVDPRAGRRAWMSLMGPLPGIVIGWALLAASFFLEASPSWLTSLATVFLFINYLNVLPIPPLDGAHVLEALLPPRWARVQSVVIGLCAAAGIVLALVFKWYVIAVLALLQFPVLAAGWRLHGIERALAEPPDAPPRPREQQLRRILDEFEVRNGPTVQAALRVKQALEVLHRLELRPMGTAARAVTTLVYASLLAGPIAALVLWLTLGGQETL